jgi:hypothetical protein
MSDVTWTELAGDRVVSLAPVGGGESLDDHDDVNGNSAPDVELEAGGSFVFHRENRRAHHIVDINEVAGSMTVFEGTRPENSYGRTSRHFTGRSRARNVFNTVGE